MTMHDRASRAALWQAYRHHALHAWTPARHDPHAEQYARALLLGWLWEPRPGTLAITEAGLAELSAFMGRRPDRTDKPTEALT
jgi:hypothetical protein